MSHLETLKERLKLKPEVRPNEGVRVRLDLQEEKKISVGEKNPTIITSEKDEGKRAQDILEKIKQNKLTAVVKKLPEEQKVQTQAPVVEIQKKKKLKKLEKDVIILDEEIEKKPEELPEGGPRLEDILLEKYKQPVVEEKIV